MAYDADEQKALDEKHATDPQPGDYWQEMLMGVLVVLSRTGDLVHICDGKKDAGRDHWTWDFKKLKTLTIEQFKKRLGYGTIPGYWASVWPGAHMWAVKEMESSSRWPDPENDEAPPPKKVQCHHCAGTGVI